MTDFPFQIVGFDLDGTVLDTSDDLLAATNHAMALADRPLLEANAIKGMIGRGAKHMLIEGLEATGGYTTEEFKPLYRALLDFYAAHVSVHTKPFPGAVAAIDQLRAMGVRTAVVTNKFERFAEAVLRDLGIHDRFDTVIGGDTLGKGREKPAPDPIYEMVARLGGGHAVFIGDSIYDAMAARGAGIPFVAVRFGFLLGPVEALEGDAVLDQYEDLIPVLRAISAKGAEATS